MAHGSLGSDQVHVPASELLRDPLQFVRLLDTHRVAYTFAPSFFLNKIWDSMLASQTFTADLSSLKALISGSESNVAVTCDELTRKLRRLGVSNERFFNSIAETAETYASQIRQTQPIGPYAIPGYSLGSTQAFEVAKTLEAQGQEVKFLASIDYPPHIARYIRNLN